MKYFDNQILQELKTRTEVQDVIQNYLPLKRVGNAYKCVCPFHDDHSPSMHVTPHLGIYKCFVCGAGGDVFKFVQEYEKIDFPAAVEKVADLAGYVLPEKDDKAKIAIKHQKDLISVNRLATDFFMMNLKPNTNLQEYLGQRGLKSETVELFQLGWAPESWDALTKYAGSKGIASESLMDAGLVKQSDKGKVYDAFRSRLIFPIFNLSQQVVAFGGRVLDNTQQPKYLNSPETKLYHKSEILYGLSHSKNAIMNSKEVIFVEGYMDFLQLFQSGIENVVAVSGTALTTDHGKIISRYADKAFLIFDGDKAGINAARRSLQTLLKYNMTIQVLILPDGEDPDSLVKEKGKNAFLEYIANKSVDFVDFQLMDVRTSSLHPTEKSNLVQMFKEHLTLIKDPVVKHEYVRKIASRLDVKENMLAVQSSGSVTQAPNIHMDQGRNIPRKYVINEVELRFVSLILNHIDIFKLALDTLDLDLVQSEEMTLMLDSAFCYYEEHDDLNLKLFYDSLNREGKEIYELFVNQHLSNMNEYKLMVQEYASSLLTLELTYLQKVRKDLRTYNVNVEESWSYLSKMILEINQLKSALFNDHITADIAISRYIEKKEALQGFFENSGA